MDVIADVISVVCALIMMLVLVTCIVDIAIFIHQENKKIDEQEKIDGK